MNFKTIFHYLSYIQYPLMMVAVYCMIKPLLGTEGLETNSEYLFQHLNSGLIFMGLAISFSSLQDTTKTQNEMSRKIWESPVKGKVMIITLCSMILFFLVLGLTGYYKVQSGILKDVSIGFMVLGLGMFGMLKSAIEMFENHREDKNHDDVLVIPMQPEKHFPKSTRPRSS